MTDNRRLEPRKNAFLFGSIYLDERPLQLDCLVWDESQCGAMIEVSEPGQIPDRFNLAIGPHRRPRICTVVRRDGRRLAVVFEHGLGPASA
ncbi:pilus assembly protein PilZ [Methylobacterium gnaphalii]|uniref:PilZ domain-containing protein n=1 Tax=Methylobacterium gnaphalii TaxID=1010610 RepID=A0A512JJG7_9HYPH|nr:pilus assembly protein PilZ [Methylobacterium gnaphalii]GEP10073.1 hypothetical protein MGN01_19180 [Methylobacterium gnaphalii]GJD67663.1 hypothetical protein MMMDOFMJ_0579 [Methylobacterium gnaphalii]GLS48342.1 hypothetical protein GCM10007885_11860 [Methylobacterium gnaphalii]